ncbi:hypothetical protein [Rhodopseudomonas sp. RCAM05734]|uniref:hypothetical protein n=1 Tax=Rhodopseudomonas sp. RCAM05734 TaxID=3457549 RepID=UPI004043C820
MGTRSPASAEIHIEDAELKTGDGKQRMLLFGRRTKALDLILRARRTAGAASPTGGKVWISSTAQAGAAKARPVAKARFPKQRRRVFMALIQLVDPAHGSGGRHQG